MVNKKQGGIWGFFSTKRKEENPNEEQSRKDEIEGAKGNEYPKQRKPDQTEQCEEPSAKEMKNFCRGKVLNKCYQEGVIESVNDAHSLDDI